MPEAITIDEAREQLMGAERESWERVLGVWGQAEEICTWAESHDKIIVGHVQENAVSGATPLVFRRDLVRALWDAQDGKHSGFVFVSQDRLARDVEVAEQLRHACQWAGLKLYSIELGRDIARGGETASQRHERHRLDWEAENFLHTLAMAGVKRRLAKRDRGGKSGGRPFHRKFGVEVVTFHGRSEYRPVPAEQAVIARAQRLEVEGTSRRKIAQLFNDEGIRTVTGVPWTHKTIGDLMGPGRLCRLEIIEAPAGTRDRSSVPQTPAYAASGGA